MRIFFKASPRLATILAVASFALIATASQASTLITFDDQGDGAPIAAGYSGLTWNNLYSLNGTLDNNSGYLNGVVSPNNVMYNGDGNPANFSSASNFTLTSAYLTAAWNDGLNVTITGLENGTALFTTTDIVNTSGPTLETFNWAGINEVDFSSAGGTHNPSFNGFGTHFALDNLTLNGSAAVPEPSQTAALSVGLLGLAGMALVARKRQVRA